MTIGEELDLTITSREFGLEERVPMIGYPYHVADKYTEKILEKHSVVVVEPQEEPKYILSNAEAREQSKDPLESMTPVENADLPFDVEGESEEEYEEEEEEREEEQEEPSIHPQRKEKSMFTLVRKNLF